MFVDLHITAQNHLFHQKNYALASIYLQDRHAQWLGFLEQSIFIPYKRTA